MVVIGLTGGIGMGKSTVAGQLAQLGARVCNADAIVHDLLARHKPTIRAIDRLFPGAVTAGRVDRKALGAIVFKDKDKLKQLEALLHPQVVAEENRFIEKERRKGTPLVVLDIPLLFETGRHESCDVTLVASAPLFLQRQRVMRRPGMTADRFEHILATQLPDRKKRFHADWVVLTGLGKAYSFRKTAELVRGLMCSVK